MGYKILFFYIITLFVAFLISKNKKIKLETDKFKNTIRFSALLTLVALLAYLFFIIPSLPIKEEKLAECLLLGMLPVAIVYTVINWLVIFPTFIYEKFKEKPIKQISYNYFFKYFFSLYLTINVIAIAFLLISPVGLFYGIPLILIAAIFYFKKIK